MHAMPSAHAVTMAAATRFQVAKSRPTLRSAVGTSNRSAGPAAQSKSVGGVWHQQEHDKPPREREDEDCGELRVEPGQVGVG